MINWILKKETNTIVYLFYSPWFLLLLIPFTPFYGDLNKVWIPLIFIFLIELFLYHLFTIIIGNRLILLDNGRFTTYTVKSYIAHYIFSIINLLLACSFIILNPKDNFSVLFIVIYFISELFRAKKLANLIVALELEQKLNFKKYLLTFYLVINPFVGLWNLHSRLKKLMLKYQL